MNDPRDAAGPLGRGPRSLLGSALAAAATCAGLLALSRLIEPGSWLSSACSAVVLLAAVTAAARTLGRSAGFPSLVGTLAGVLGVLVQYGGPRAGSPAMPGPAAIGHTIGLFSDGIRLIQRSLVPMAAERSAELVVVVAAIAVFLLVDALALGADVPALAALPLVTFWLPAVFLGFPATGWAIFLAGLPYLLLLALSVVPSVGDTARARQSATVVGGAAAALAAAIALGPVVSALPAWASVTLPVLGTGAFGPVRLSGDLDLRDSLGRRSQQTVLTFVVSRPAAVSTSTAGGATVGRLDPADGQAPGDAGGQTSSAPPVPPDSRAVGPLRAFTLTQFDGRTWHPDPTRPAPDDWEQSQLIGPGARAGQVPDPLDPRLVQVEVTIGELEQSQLPISAFPRAVQVEGPWGYDPVKDEIVGRRATTPGMRYTMQVLTPMLTGADLRAAAVVAPPGDADYLELAQTDHLAEVQAFAQQLTARSTTPYDQAMALQSYLRSPANFTYDTQVPPARSGDAVWDFLQDRRGYCVQFATAMAVMARTLGIPTRVAVGFLPGDSRAVTGGNEYTITGRQTHAWPEIYFAGYGWVRFEPTPATQTGLPPAWSDPLANVSSGGATAGPGDIRDPLAGHDVPGATAGPGASNQGAGGGHGSWLPFGVLVGALGAAAVAAALMRRWRRGPAELTCEHAWHQVRRVLDRRAIAWTDATTPRAAVTTVQRRFAQQTGKPLDRAAADALSRLASAVEQERYAPQPVAPTSAELHRWLGTVKHAVDRELSGRSRRGGGPSVPPAAP